MFPFQIFTNLKILLKPIINNIVMRKPLVSFVSICMLSILFQSCKKDNISTSTDTDLYNVIKNANSYTYYAGTTGITPGTGNSPHGFERVRFNSVAQAALDSTGKFPVGVLSH